MKDRSMPLHSYRYEAILNVIRNEKPTVKTALDVGCNLGLFSSLMIEKGLRVTGLELDRKLAKLAWSNLKDIDFDLVIGDAASLPFIQQTFDLIICGEVIEHLLHPDLLLKDSNRSLKNSGELILSTPNAAGLWSILFDRMFFGFYKLKTHESKAGQGRTWGKDQHISLFTYDSLLRCLNLCGFLTIKVYERRDKNYDYYENFLPKSQSNVFRPYF
jgi:2-polyprenyl-3-methyl-5-hydroxy-6-metoxy-1,4-benzoquinol methylase